MSEVIVHQIAGAWGLPSVGPFCLKLETYLKMADIPYRTIDDATPFQGPKGKLPWIEHEGRKIGDSGMIIEYLEEKLGRKTDAGLSDSELASARALRRLLEENLYWTIVHDRWMIDENWAKARDVILGGVPAPIRAVLAPIAKRGVRKQLEGHGIGRHTRDEIHAIGCSDVRAVAQILGEKPFLMGDSPTQIDAVAYGILANIACVPIESPVKQEIQSHPNLVDYLERVRQRYYA